MSTTRKFFWTGLLPLMLLAALGAQQPRLDVKLPGLAARADQVSEVTLDGAALRIGMAFLNSGDSGLSQQDRQALAKLQGIYVKSFEFKRAPRLTDPGLAAIRNQLRQPGWARIVSVHSKGRDGDNDNAEIYICSAKDGSILGMAILNREPGELDIVNIVGSITPEELSKLGGNLGIPRLVTSGKGKGGRL
ncbi:MAG: DUF4252 domain-containing protein [Terriglobales bacterium]